MKSLLPLLRAVSAVALFAMMVLTFADVMARKFLPNAIVGAVELTELLMMVMIFVALPLASAAGEHIAFDLFDRMLPPEAAAPAAPPGPWTHRPGVRRGGVAGLAARLSHRRRR
jgi:TRAP-type C4-dicarboxylate transport system permease small subunit